jgi:hypothetical protein
LQLNSWATGTARLAAVKEKDAAIWQKLESKFKPFKAKKAVDSRFSGLGRKTGWGGRRGGGWGGGWGGAWGDVFNDENEDEDEDEDDDEFGDGQGLY